MDPATFRAAFSEFADETVYPDALIQMWLTYAASMVNATRWGVLTTLGVQLVAAHNVVLSARDEAAGSAGAAPGTASGPVSSKSIDRLSVSYDAGAIAIAGGGSWNMTSYGIRYITLSQTMGGGALQL